MKSPSSCRLALRCWHLALACLFSLFASVPAHAAGVAAMKEQPFHSDNLAKPLVYLSLKSVSPQVWKINTGSSVTTVDKSKIAGFVEIPAGIPAEITTEAELKPLRDLVAELQAFTKKYPKCEPTLRAHVEAFGGHVAKWDQGMVRHGGKWMTKAEFAATGKKREEEKAAHAKRQEEAEAYAASQRAKGLELFDGEWRSAAEVARLKAQRLIEETAAETVASRSISGADYTVLQVTQKGFLITVTGGKTRQGGINASVAYLFGVETSTGAEGDEYHSHLYWCGNHTYATQDGGSRTVHAYCLVHKDAVAAVTERLLAEREELAQGGREAEEEDENRPSPPSPAAGKNPEILAGSKGSGSAFFVGSEGYLVTNEHVVRDAKSLDIHYQDRLIPAQVVKVSKVADLALLKIDHKVEGLPIVETEAQPGSDVFAIGFPQPAIQGIGVKVTKGIISGSEGVGDDDTRFQIDAALQPGNSGGPLCDSAGHLVGVSVAVLDPIAMAQLTGNLPQNVNYAIKASEVLAFLRTKEIAITTVKPAVEGATGTTDAMEKALKATVLVIRR